MLFYYASLWCEGNFRVLKLLFALRSIRLSTLSLLLLTGPTEILAQQTSFIGWIPVQTLASGKTTEIDLTRFLSLAPGAKLEMERPAALEKLKVELDAPGQTLRLTPEAGLQGLEDLVLRIRPAQGEPLEGIFTLAVQSAPETKFRYFGTGSEKSVSVAGSFNGWNTGAHPMKKTGENTWELSLPLPPGSHTYKLVVDGQWRLDPANKQKAGDGTGNENSLVQVSGTAGPAPVLFARARSAETLTFGCHPEDWKPANISAVAQLPGGASRSVPAEPSAGGGWQVKTAGLPPEAWIRIMGVGSDGSSAFPTRARVGEDPPAGASRHDHIMYFAFIDRLVDGDPSNNPKPDPRVEPPAQYFGGDLAGVKKLIDDGYFEKLGINTLWLSPVNQNPLPPYQEFKEPRRWYTGYHGYWPISSTEVDSRFGGNDALTALANSAEKRNISILLDLVLAHVHEEHPTFKKNPDWFGSLMLPDGTRNLRKWDNETQFTTWFEPFLPRFNYDSPAGTFLIDNAVDWIKRFNLDGFRLDAVKHIPPKYWTGFREGLRQGLPQTTRESFYLVGETFMDRPGINSFIGPNRLDGQFEFPLYDTLLEVFGTGKEDFASLERSAASSDRVFGPETVMSPLLGNHDKSRFMAYADGDLPDPKEPDEFVVGWTKPPKVDQDSSYKKLKLAFTFVLTTSGAPTIYYGDEIGMTGAQDPDNRRMFPDPAKLTPAEKSVQDHVAKLNSLRAKHPAIRYGSRRAILAERDTYAVARAYLGDRVLLLYNRSDKPAKLALNVGPEFTDGSLQDRLGVLKEVSVKNGFVDITLPALSSAYLTP
jgi:glycosidase